MERYKVFIPGKYPVSLYTMDSLEDAIFQATLEADIFDEEFASRDEIRGFLIQVIDNETGEIIKEF